MPFLAVCPECHYPQVCVLPASSFPRVKCCRCRVVYDPVGTDDTEVIPELAGATIVRLVQERRAARARARAAPGRRRRRTRGRGPAAAGAAQGSAEAIAAAILSEPLPGPAGWPPGPDSVTPVPQSPVAPAGPRPDRPRRPRRAPPAGTSATPLAAGSFFLVGATLVVAATATTGFLAQLLALASLLLGLWAVRAAVRGHVRARYAVLVTGLAAAVAAAVFGVPGLIGIDRPATPAWAEADVQVVPFPPFAADPAVWAAEWVDASKAALQQGPVRVAVADVRPGVGTGGLGPGLVVRLRLSRTPGLDPPGGSAGWDPAHPAALWDAAGARYDQRSAAVGPAAGPASVGGHEADPDGPADDGMVVTLEFPRPPRPGPLRLELPAAAWGGRGRFRFTIPAGAVNW